MVANEIGTKIDKSSLATGGGLLLGVGAGFFFLPQSPLAFTGCVVGGLGLGLLLTSVLSAVGRA